MDNHESCNRVIAEYVAARIDSWPDKTSTWIVGHTGNEIWHNVDSADWAFHTSWEWIMPVVEKIDMMDSGKVDCQVIIETFSVRIRYFDGKNKYEWANGGSSKIDSCWTAIVRFINWYNTQKTITHE